jgi:hypothetical protein
VTCLPPMEPPAIFPPFAVAAAPFAAHTAVGDVFLSNPAAPPRVAGFFMGHPLWSQRLSAGKAAECRGFAVFDRCQQAQGKHGKECRGKQPENVSGQIGHSTILSVIHPKTGQPAAMNTANIDRSGTDMPATGLMLSATSPGRRPRRRSRQSRAGYRRRAPGHDPVSSVIL